MGKEKKVEIHLHRGNDIIILNLSGLKEQKIFFFQCYWDVIDTQHYKFKVCSIMTRHMWNEHHHKLTTITLYSYKNIFVLLVMRTIRIYSLSNFSVNSSVNYIVVMYFNYIKGLFLYPAADPIQVVERALCSLQFLWGSAWWRLYLHNTISTLEEGAWRIMYQLKCCCPELTWVTIPHFIG